ncbi:MAG: EscT/YscT/HrcT family type III secretion system export apparatus protein [Myxococcota bacterium]
MELGRIVELWLPHVVGVALCGARFLPVAFLCPLFGGVSAPTTVRLALVLTLAMAVHLAGGVGAPHVDGAWSFAGAAVRELLFGISLGLIASLPFDAARMGGRFIDLFRGSSAEATLPAAGTQESATGDGLYQLLVALAVSSAAFPAVLGGLFKSFQVVPLGAFVAHESVAMTGVRTATAALTTGLAVGAPIAGAAMAVDCVLGFASRIAPQMNLQEVGAPLRILGGGAVVWLSLGVLCERLLGEVLGLEHMLHSLSEAAR